MRPTCHWSQCSEFAKSTGLCEEHETRVMDAVVADDPLAATVMVRPDRPGVVLIHGAEQVAFVRDDDTRHALPNFGPIDRAVVVARLRALADLVADDSPLATVAVGAPR